MVSKMKICKKCIQPDSRPGIYFDENGICGACLWEEEKKSIDWEVREKELHKIAEWAKKTKTGNYDCAIGVSGGKDSTKQVIVARDVLGLRCLLVNCEPEGITKLGQKNMENLKNQGFDVITIRPNPKIIKKLIQHDFFIHLNPVKATEFPLYSSTYVIAEHFSIPLIIQGENPGLTLGTSLTGVGKDENSLKANQLQTLANGVNEYLELSDVEEKDLFFYQYDRERLEKNNVKGIWLQYYLKEWSFRGNADFSRKHGFAWRDDNLDPNSIGTHMTFARLDSDIVPVNQMLKYVKFGFGQCMDDACYDIREGLITREEAIKLVNKYDGKCDEKYIKQFCDYIEISIEEFWNIANKFRGSMWKKDSNGNWQNQVHKLLNT